VSTLTEQPARPGLARTGRLDRFISSGRQHPGLVAWLAALIVVMGVGLAAFAWQSSNGLVVTGMRNTVMWGQYILFFMFFIGLSAGGLIVASAGRLFGASMFKPITRLAVVEATVAVLLEAASGVTDMPSAQPTVVTDSGVENVNDTVDHLIESGRLRRLLAMTEITGSNSMIEAWWRTLKHQWLYLTPLDSLAAIERLVAFYVTEHNSRLPHSALSGETPDERYFGTGEHVARQLEAARAAARNARLEANRAAACGVCEGQREIASRT